jgi:hypothetical protein
VAVLDPVAIAALLHAIIFVVGSLVIVIAPVVIGTPCAPSLRSPNAYT